MKPVTHLLPGNKFVCFVIPKLFSKQECEELLSEEIKSGFQKANSNYPVYYRNNDRLVIDDPELADFLFTKVKNYLPENIYIDSTIEAENGHWSLNALNERLRYCRYSANQYFHRHLDGVHYRSATTQSKLTFMLYLNSATEFTGGRTLFFNDRETTEILAAYTPQQGDLIVFDHNLWHEGEELCAGVKYVLRSDILYNLDVEKFTVSRAPYSQGHLGYIWKLLRFDEHTLLSTGRDKEIKCWNERGTLLQRLSGHSNSILCLEKINESCFASGSRDKHIKIWYKKQEGFELHNNIVVHDAIVLSITTLSQNIFASSSGDRTIKVCTIDGQVLRSYNEHQAWVWQVLKLEQHIIASCSEDGDIKIWDTRNDASLITYSEEAAIFCLDYNGNKKQLAYGNIDGSIVIKTLSNNFLSTTTNARLKAHTGIIRTILFICEKWLASGGEDGKVKIWDIETGNCLAEYEHNNFVQSIMLLNANQIMTAAYDGTMKIWNLPVSL